MMGEQQGNSQEMETGSPLSNPLLRLLSCVSSPPTAGNKKGKGRKKKKGGEMGFERMPSLI